jgi:hypothetical protein
MIMKKRAEVELAALELGYKAPAIRKWASRGSLPAKVQLKMNDHFGGSVIVAEFQTKTSLADRALDFCVPS